MNFGFLRLKLSVKLVLLIAIPVLLLITLISLFIKNSEITREYASLFFVCFLLFVVYIVFAVNFIINLSKGIKVAESFSLGAVSGKYKANGRPAGLRETKVICEAVSTLTKDIHRQTTFAEQLKGGNLDITYEPRHENDQLGLALISIKENLISIKKEDEQRSWTSEGLAKFVLVLQSIENLKQLSNSIIINLVRMVKANQGAIFFLVKEDNEEVLEMQACYAFNRSKHLTQKINPGDGIVGQAFLEKQTVYLKEVPEEFVRITSGLGESNPRYILIVPLKMNETVVGVVELASFTPFSQHIIAFIEKVGESIAHSVWSFRNAENTRLLLEESKIHAEEMRAQEEELRQNQEELQATQEAISRKYETLFKNLGALNYQSKFDQLKSITSTKKRNIEYYFDIIRNQIRTFAENTMAIDSFKAFKEAFYKIDEVLPSEKFQAIRTSVTAYYASEFIPKLNDFVSRELYAEAYVPQEIRALIFQDLYIAGNPYPTGNKSSLNDANDGSDYSSVHAQYHPIYRNFLEKFGYYDIFLIDAVTGDMLYSVFKEVDFATNLVKGLYSKTNFGKVVQSAIRSKDKDFVQLIDFEPYDPSYNAPASFIASVVYDGDEKVGILVFQMPINKINQILTGNNNWREDGLGESGETFIVGNDYKLRSNARHLIEDMEGHLSLLKSRNYSRTVIQQIRKMNTNILMEEMKTDGIGKALLGVSGTAIENNQDGKKILNAYAPLNIPDVRWVIASTMLEEEASLRIKNLRDENS
jgi:putative methionine-R-sulfoxide reductase with GAF domain